MIIGIILISQSHALFSTNTLTKSVITIKVGEMNVIIKVDGINTNLLTIPKGETKVFTVTLENINQPMGNFLFYYIGTLAEQVTLGYVSEIGIDIPPLENGVKISSNGKQTYTLKVKNATTNAQTITLGSQGGLENLSIPMPTGANVIGEYIEETTDESCFFFDEELGSIYLYDGEEPCPKDVIIPSEINGVKVVSIDGSSFSQINLTSVVIPDSVTYIGDSAFADNDLTSVTLGNGVETIAQGAFNNNPLTSINIPNSVTTIEAWAFANNQLTNLELPNSVKILESGAFQNNQLVNVTLSNKIALIDANAFSNNKIKSITIPTSVTKIGDYAFEKNQLTSVSVPTSVTTIGVGAFQYNQLTSAIISRNVSSIGNIAFYKTTSSNPNLTKIINQTGRSFNWGLILENKSGSNFVTGTALNVTVSAS